MTLVIAAPGKDFVVVGADSRITIQDEAGNRSELNIGQKLFRVSQHVALMLYGDADAAAHLTEKFRVEGVGKMDGVSKVADKLADFCRKEYKKAKDVPMTRLPSFGLIIAGLDPKRGTYQIPRCYGMHSTSAFLLDFCKPYAIQGKDMIAQYLFRRQFVEDMTVAKLSELVARSIYDTRAIDGDVGGRIRVAIIASDGFREKQRAEVRQLLDEWDISEF